MAPERGVAAQTEEPKVIGQILVDVREDFSLSVVQQGQTGPAALWAASSLLDAIARKTFYEQQQAPAPKLEVVRDLPKGRPS